jgi:hypothetical protein
MTIAQVSHQIHRRESHLWAIERAKEGVIPYCLKFKNLENRNKKADKLKHEIIELRIQYEQLKETTPKKEWYPNRKHSGRPRGSVGSITKYHCSDGSTVTQREIDKKRSEAYRKKYQDNPHPICEGFGGKRAEGTAHIIPQSRCKKIRKTELIWDLDNMFPASHAANKAIENPKGQEWKQLKNIDKCIQFMYEHDKDLYFKFESQGWQNHPIAKVKQNP